MTVPARIGPYRIERLLGVGSFATVWLGHDPVLDSSVAIKVLAENWSHDLRVRERFLDEARLLRRLDHERLVRVHAVGELPDGRPYSVLTWADGGSLRDRLAAGPLPVPSALHLLAEIAAGAAVLHRHGVVHRDLTPGNILFRSAPDGASRDASDGASRDASDSAVRNGPPSTDGPGPVERVLIADLGLAKALAAASGLTARAGTPGYMAPEQDDPLAVVDTRADVFSLGRLGIRLLGAAGPHDVPQQVSTVLRTATAHRPADRYPDATAFQAALEQACRRPAGHRSSGSTRGLVEVGGGEGTSPAAAQRPGRRSGTTSHRLPRRLGLAAATLGWVLMVGAVGADTAPARAPAQVSVGGLTVALPPGWQAFGDGWAGQYGADGELEPGVVISPRPGRWRADPTVPGAFVGLSASTAARTTPAGFLAERPHADCVAAPVRRTRQGVIDWTVASFACGNGRPAIVEAAGVGPGGAGLVYAQIVPPSGGGSDFADRLLNGIQVRQPGLSRSPP